MSRRYLLIDGKNLLFRAGYVARNLKTSDGRYSGAFHGFIMMLNRMRKEFLDAEFIVLWERSGQRTYRHNIYEGYKQRTSKHEDSYNKAIHAQIESVTQFCHDIGLKWVQLAGIEADDIAGMLSTYLSARDHEVILFSGDRDWWQLAPILGVSVVCEQGNARHVPMVTDRYVQAIMGVKAKELVKFRAFIGDTSDRIPPVKPRFLKRMALQLVAAGADPRKSFVEQNHRVKEILRAKKLEVIWPNYQRNYRLMRIARSAADCGVSETEFSRVLDIITSQPEKNLRSATKLLANWELNDALSKSDIIFSIASPRVTR